MLFALVSIVPVLARIKVKIHGLGEDASWVLLLVVGGIAVLLWGVKFLIDWTDNRERCRHVPGFKVGLKYSEMILPCPVGRCLITVDSDVQTYKAIVEKEVPSGIPTIGALALCPGLASDPVCPNSTELDGLGMIKMVFDHAVDRAQLGEVFDVIERRYAEKDAELEVLALAYKGEGELAVRRCVRQIKSTRSFLRTTLLVKGIKKADGFFTELKVEKYLLLNGYVICFVGIRTFGGLNVKSAFAAVVELEKRVGNWSRAAISMTNEGMSVPEDDEPPEADDWRASERVEQLEKELQGYVKSGENAVRSGDATGADGECADNKENDALASAPSEDRCPFDVEKAVKAPRLFTERRVGLLWDDSPNENLAREFVSKSGNFCVRLGSEWAEEPEVRRHPDGSCAYRFAGQKDLQWFAVTHRKCENAPAITDLVRWALTSSGGDGLALEFPNSAARASSEILSFSNFPLLDRSFRDKHSADDMSMHFATFRLKGRSHRVVIVTLRRGGEDWKLELVNPIPDVGDSTNAKEGISDGEVSAVGAIFGTFRTLDSVRCVFCGKPVHDANKKLLSVQLNRRADSDHILTATLKLPYCLECDKMKRNEDARANWKRILISLGISLSIGGCFSFGVVKGDTQDHFECLLYSAGALFVFVGLFACVLISPDYRRKILKHPDVEKLCNDGFKLCPRFKTVK